jgi:hypothetical protein
VFGLFVALVLWGHQEQSMGVAGANSAVKKVKSDNGQTLTEALRKAKPGDMLQVTGTCHERVTITTDRLTLGGGNAVLDGGRGVPHGVHDSQQSQPGGSRRGRRGVRG